MARSRNIKPGFFKNELLVDLDPLTRLLFIGLWTIADREGRLEDRPKRIKMEILPCDNCDVDSMLDELSQGQDPFIYRYEHPEIPGKRFIQIAKWTRHQHPHHKESESEIPCMDQKPRASLGQAPTQASTSPSDSLNSDSLNSDSLNPVRESSKEDSCSEPEEPASEPSQFTFPTTGKGGKSWTLPQHKLDEYVEAYPAIDVEREFVRARLWLVNNPARQKATQRGMLRFLTTWLNTEQNKRGGNPSKAPGEHKQRLPTPEEDAQWSPTTGMPGE